MRRGDRSDPAAAPLRVARVAATPPGAEAVDPAFDVTPAELIDGFVTDRGIVAAETAALARAFGRAPISA